MARLKGAIPPIKGGFMSLLAAISLPQSAFPPLALGFFGLGTGYLIYGPQELAGWPKRDDRVDRATGVWGIWLPGFCQFVTGIILFIGLTWFQVFAKTPPFYMAALAFSAYGIHWFALGWNRYRGNDPRPNAGMCVAFMVISAMGATVFYKVGTGRSGCCSRAWSRSTSATSSPRSAQSRRAGTRPLPPGHRRLADVPHLRDRGRLHHRIPLEGLTPGVAIGRG